VRERGGVGFVAVIARKGQAIALAERIRSAYALTLPTGPRRVTASNLVFVGTAPGAWLASREPDAGLAAELRERLAGRASISDQSGGLAVLRLSGPKVRDVLAKGIPIDLHASAFQVGDFAATICAHIGVMLWRLEDDPVGQPAFELAVHRSLAGSLWNWLAATAAEFGLTVEA
jgi:sarcosine oxidase subunit gamma